MTKRLNQIALIKGHVMNLQLAVENGDDVNETRALLELIKACNAYDTLHRTSLIDAKKLTCSSEITVGNAIGKPSIMDNLLNHVKINTTDNTESNVEGDSL